MSDYVAEVRDQRDDMRLLARFYGPPAEERAAAFIGTLPDYEAGRYDLTVWPHPDYEPPPPDLPRRAIRPPEDNPTPEDAEEAARVVAAGLDLRPGSGPSRTLGGPITAPPVPPVRGPRERKTYTPGTEPAPGL